MHSATCSIWSRKVKLKVSGKTGAIHFASHCIAMIPAEGDQGGRKYCKDGSGC